MASQHIVGAHVAMFTATEVLSAAAFLEFRPQVDALLAQGGWAGALRLWSSVVMFEHMPPSTRPGDGPSVCPRCDQGRGGYLFPWIGIWNHRGTVVPSGLTPQQAWDRHARLEASMDLLLLQPYRAPYFPMTWPSCPSRPSSPKFCIICGTGSWDPRMGCGSTPSSRPCRMRTGCPVIWVPFTQSSVHIEPFVVGWDPQRGNGISSGMLWLW